MKKIKLIKFIIFACVYIFLTIYITDTSKNDLFLIGHAILTGLLLYHAYMDYVKN